MLCHRESTEILERRVPTRHGGTRVIAMLSSDPMAETGTPTRTRNMSWRDHGWKPPRHPQGCLLQDFWHAPRVPQLHAHMTSNLNSFGLLLRSRASALTGICGCLLSPLHPVLGAWLATDKCFSPPQLQPSYDHSALPHLSRLHPQSPSPSQTPPRGLEDHHTLPLLNSEDGTGFLHSSASSPAPREEGPHLTLLGYILWAQHLVNEASWAFHSRGCRQGPWFLTRGLLRGCLSASQPGSWPQSE